MSCRYWSALIHQRSGEKSQRTTNIRNPPAAPAPPKLSKIRCVDAGGYLKCLRCLAPFLEIRKTQCQRLDDAPESLGSPARHPREIQRLKPDQTQGAGNSGVRQP